MISHIAFAEGSPSPTLVLPADRLPTDEGPLLAALTDTRAWMIANGGADITKYALVGPSTHPLFDLDYRFVQVIPGPGPRFDLRGSCGHSILASVLAAHRFGWLPALSPGHRARVNVLNNGDHVVCEIEQSAHGASTMTAHFLHHPAVSLTDLLLLAQPTTDLPYPGGTIRTSLVDVGNPYVFVDAADLGVISSDQLYADDTKLFATLTDIRRSAARELGWPPEGAFPKIAAVLADGPGGLAVRAVSVPSWHPTLALTGVVCLAAAVRIDGTVPNLLAGPTGHGQPLRLRTPNGEVRPSASITANDALSWVSVPSKTVRHLGRLDVEPLVRHALRETVSCLPLR